MRNFVLALLVGTIALVPAFAAAQTGTGSGGSKPSGTSGSSGSGSGSSSMPSSGTSGSSGSGSSSSPSASPSGADLSTYKTQADCEKNGGMWTASTKSCEKK